MRLLELERGNESWEVLTGELSKRVQILSVFSTEEAYLFEAVLSAFCTKLGAQILQGKCETDSKAATFKARMCRAISAKRKTT